MEKKTAQRNIPLGCISVLFNNTEQAGACSSIYINGQVVKPSGRIVEHQENLLVAVSNHL